MSLISKITSNSALIANKLNNLHSLILTVAPAVQQKAQAEKARLDQENAALKQEIQSLVHQINELEADTGPHADVFRVKSDVPAAVSKPAAKPAVVAAPKADAVPVVSKSSAAPAAKPSAKKQPDAAADRPADVSRLDFRVGRIITAKKHPDADGLYVEEVDVGEGKLRTVVSGLVKFVPLDQMQDRLVLLLCNLKPAKMRGVTSEAMVMCASTPDKVEILIPPADAAIGDRAVVDGFPGEPDAQLNPKKKIFEECAPHLKTNEKGIACYKDVPITIPGKGGFTSTLTGVQVK
jgi:aminoacyl tRNA synthase complex-interacting multifunctional protein 1